MLLIIRVFRCMRAYSLEQEFGTEIVLKWLPKKKKKKTAAPKMSFSDSRKKQLITENKSKSEDRMIMSRSALFQYATVNTLLLFLY